MQARNSRVLLYAVVLQIVQPFVERALCHIVELVDTYDVIFREYVFGYAELYLFILLCVYLKHVAGVYADKGCLAVIQIV